MNRLALLVTLVPLLGAQPDRFGIPACATPDQELASRRFFILCHSASRKVPVWVGYELKPEHLGGAAPRPSHFRRDFGLSHDGASNSDYTHSGYSRGHMAPAADFAWSTEAIHATFLLSNAVPQRQSVNAGLWAQLERAVRRLTLDADSVHVFTGPIFEGEVSTIGAGRVAVPSHFFKAILVQRAGVQSMYAAILPNSQNVWKPLSRYSTTVDEVEQRSGFDFFPALDDDEEEVLESGRSLSAREQRD